MAKKQTKVAYDGMKSKPNERLHPGEPPPMATLPESPYSNARLNNGTGPEAWNDDMRSMLAGRKNDRWMYAWVRKNCKFARTVSAQHWSDPPMEDPGLDVGSEPELGDRGSRANDSAGFHQMFEQWVQQDNLQQYVDEFRQNKGLLPGVPLSADQMFEFMREGDVPEWAHEFCPGHQYEHTGNGYSCTTCNDFEEDADPTAAADMAGDREYDRMVDDSL